MTALLVAACGGSGDESNDAQPSATTAPTAGVTTLARATMEDGRKVKLQSLLGKNAAEEYAADYEDPGLRAAVPPPCLRLVGIDDEIRQCGTPFQTDVDGGGNPIIVDSIQATAIAQTRPSAPLEIYGPTPASTEIVKVRYVVADVPQHVRAVVFIVDEEEALQSGYRDPFAFFFAELPQQASNVSATAYSASDKLGSVSFDRLIRTSHPHVFIQGRV